MKKLFVFTDGGSRGNPGKAAIGAIIKSEGGQIIARLGKELGEATNNVAEYQAVIEALRWIAENPLFKKDNEEIFYHFFLDSALVVNQLNGLFKIKDPKLRNMLIQIRELEQRIGGNVFYTLIPREKNQEADFLVNQVLDGKF